MSRHRSDLGREIQEAIRKTRMHHGWNQTELAEKLGVNFLTVNRWENGHTLPQKHAAKRLMSLVPGECRPALEELVGMTFEQVMAEGSRSDEPPSRTEIEFWEADTLRYSLEIASHTRSLVSYLLRHARTQNRQAADSLMAVLKTALAEREKTIAGQSPASLRQRDH